MYSYPSNTTPRVGRPPNKLSAESYRCLLCNRRYSNSSGSRAHVRNKHQFIPRDCVGFYIEKTKLCDFIHQIARPIFDNTLLPPPPPPPPPHTTHGLPVTSLPSPYTSTSRTTAVAPPPPSRGTSQQTDHSPPPPPPPLLPVAYPLSQTASSSIVRTNGGKQGIDNNNNNNTALSYSSLHPPIRLQSTIRSRKRPRLNNTADFLDNTNQPLPSSSPPPPPPPPLPQIKKDVLSPPRKIAKLISNSSKRTSNSVKSTFAESVAQSVQTLPSTSTHLSSIEYTQQQQMNLLSKPVESQSVSSST